MGVGWAIDASVRAYCRSIRSARLRALPAEDARVLVREVHGGEEEVLQLVALALGQV